MTRRTLFWKLAYLAIAVGAFMIDQTSKSWAAHSLRLGGEKSVISGFMSFAYAQNPGVAFSMFDQQGDAGRWGLSIVAFIAGVLVLFFFWRTPRYDDRILGTLALLLAGIIGNLTDRLLHGHVIDFLLFDLHVPLAHPWPAFNVADSCICIAVLFFLIHSFRQKRSSTEIAP